MYESDPLEYSFLVFGFVLLRPGTTLDNVGSPENSTVVSGTSNSYFVGDFNTVLETDGYEFVFPVISVFNDVNTRFPYEDLLASVRPFSGTVFYQQTSWNPDTCEISQDLFDPVDGLYPLEPGCGFKFFKALETVNDVFVLKLNPYRVGQFVIDFVGNSDTIVDGEEFETVLNVEISEIPTPPPVSDVSYNYTFNFYGYELYPYQIFNIFTPPRSSDDGAVGGKIVAGGADFLMNFSRSDTVTEQATYTLVVENIAGIPDGVEPETPIQPDFFITFASSGETEVIQLPPGSFIEFSTSDSCGTSFLNNTDPEFDIIQFALEFLFYNPVTTTEWTCTKVVDALSGKFPGSVLESQIRSVTAPTSSRALRETRRIPSDRRLTPFVRQDEDSGSVVTVRSRVLAEDSANLATQINDYLESDEFAEDIFMDPDWFRTTEAPEVEAPSLAPTQSGGGGGAGSGFPAWAIAVISVIAGLLLILIIAIGLFLLLARGEEEDTESSYQSDGPALVPRPDDILYQQAIVRDEYGRGEWSEPLEGEEVEMENGIRAEVPRIVA
eukprot:CAMPEP_0182445686 /NCGR_PEP_ID=MMETSP1172-20130603/3726_1 /TAXON_ID=708627 /ORGANISM="Timspurckia oligopyrenoides, Strain CCMP3278" /LENGTH=552 /DNA_ID=CAMNT_0024641499 /DNA_START=702 /DNA_END=2360 /DNA_ORIENTATION=-